MGPPPAGPDHVTLFADGTGLGPFLYCDYWASVFNLRGVVSPPVLGGGRLTLGHFRRAVDRPRTRLPKLRYYILAFVFLPVLMPYRVVYDLMRLIRARAERVGHPVDAVMSRHRLGLERVGPGAVRVSLGGAPIAGRVLDPEAVRCEVSLFYPTYKLLIAGLLSLLFSVAVLPELARIAFLAPLAAHLSTLLYALLAAALFGAFHDAITAFVAPLPVLAFRRLWVEGPDSLGGLLFVSAGFVVLFFLAEWFLIPRGLPPTLFLYVNDPADPAFPYRPGHAPYWLRGTHYWVWRFVTLVPGELHKFWERDWERVECWVRADGPAAGQLEWVVGDCHYREVWYRYERQVPAGRQAAHARLLAGERSAEASLVWRLEVDMDPVFHAPYVRGAFLAPERAAGPWRSLGALAAALWGGWRRDRVRRFAGRLEELETDGTELMRDVPEHFRHFMLRQILGLPWDYWRYPMGAGATERRFLYGDADPGQAGLAAAPAFQIKVAGPEPEELRPSPRPDVGRREDPHEDPGPRAVRPRA